MAETSSDSRTLIEHARHADYDRYLCALFAPPDCRLDLFALIAFNHEVARVREAVSEPMLGRIRLQWWREQIDGLYGGTPRRHELTEPLKQAVERRRLSRAYFEALIDARERDLDDAPFEDLLALHAYACATAAPLGVLMAEVLGARDDRVLQGARAAHTAFALVGLMRAIPFHARQGRSHLPLDRLIAHGGSMSDALSGKHTPPLGATIADVLAHANESLRTAREVARSAPRPMRSALLPARLAALYRARLVAAGNNPYAPQLALSPLRRQLALWASSVTGRL